MSAGDVHRAELEAAIEHAGAAPLGGLTERVSTLIGELRRLMLVLELERLDRFGYQSTMPEIQRRRKEIVRQLGWVA